MQFIDLQTPYQTHKEEILAAIAKVLDSGKYILGPEVAELEGKLAEFIGVKHCVTCTSGTVALQMAMMNYDIGPGDEVITSDFSFMASAETIALLRATPVFVDIDPRTYNITAEAIEAAITPKTKAIMPVDLYGQCPDYDSILAVAAKHNIPVIEDGAQSFGASQKEKMACSFGDISTTSFYPPKTFGCYGDGGACFTNDDAIAEKLKMIRNHGDKSRYEHQMIGINGRMNTIQAAILLVKLKYFPAEFKQRQAVAKMYNDEFKKRQTLAAMYDKAFSKAGMRPFIERGNTSAYAQYTVAAKNRDDIREALAKQNIPTAVHYPLALHQQPVYQDLGAKDQMRAINCVNSQRASETVMSLPFHPLMQEKDIKTVVEAIVHLAQPCEITK